MSIWEAIVMGIVQGLTEFLPVSSSGHLELASALFGIEGEGNLQFTVALHGATVLSTIVVFWGEIVRLVKGFFRFKWNDETAYVIYLLISALPILFVGLFFKDQIESLFGGRLVVVGAMLLLTALLLLFTCFAKPREGSLNIRNAFVVGIAQAVAIMPGLSRSGATISTGLLLGIKREQAARFSFLMALIPIIGMNVLELFDLGGTVGVGTTQTVAGALAAFVSGLLACRLMIGIVKRGKLWWFSIYCAVLGVVAIVAA